MRVNRKSFVKRGFTNRSRRGSVSRLLTECSQTPKGAFKAVFNGASRATVGTGQSNEATCRNTAENCQTLGQKVKTSCRTPAGHVVDGQIILSANPLKIWWTH